MRVKHRSGKGAFHCALLLLSSLPESLAPARMATGRSPGLSKSTSSQARGRLKAIGQRPCLSLFTTPRSPPSTSGDRRRQALPGRGGAGGERRVEILCTAFRAASRGWLRTDSDRIRGFCLGEPGERTAYRPHHYRRRPRHVRLRAGKGQDFGYLQCDAVVDECIILRRLGRGVWVPESWLGQSPDGETSRTVARKQGSWMPISIPHLASHSWLGSHSLEQVFTPVEMAMLLLRSLDTWLRT